MFKIKQMIKRWKNVITTRKSKPDKPKPPKSNNPIDKVILNYRKHLQANRLPWITLEKDCQIIYRSEEYEDDALAQDIARRTAH